MYANAAVDTFENWVFLIVAGLFFVLICLLFCLAFKVLSWVSKKAQHPTTKRRRHSYK